MQNQLIEKIKRTKPPSLPQAFARGGKPPKDKAHAWTRTDKRAVWN